jgi:hypothetical protein
MLPNHLPGIPAKQRLPTGLYLLQRQFQGVEETIFDKSIAQGGKGNKVDSACWQMMRISTTVRQGEQLIAR